MRFLNRLQPFALLVARLALAAIMVAYGFPKVFHGGAAHMVAQVSSWGWPAWMGYLPGAAEFGGGILIGLGLLTRLAALTILGDMLVAIWKVHWHNGLAKPGGIDLPLACAALAFALIFFGAGLISADHLIWGRGHKSGG